MADLKLAGVPSQGGWGTSKSGNTGREESARRKRSHLTAGEGAELGPDPISKGSSSHPGEKSYQKCKYKLGAGLVLAWSRFQVTGRGDITRSLLEISAQKRNPQSLL